MKKNNKNKIILITCICTLSFAGVLYLHNFNNRLTINNDLSVTKSIITKQEEYEKKLTTKGFTIDNPNIVVDPYNNSPLTALIMFETESMVSPKITVHGKDKLSTFSKEFEKSKEHYLPVIGLYPDKENKITVTFGKTSKTFKIKTSKLPKNVIIPTSVKAQKEKLTNDLYFFSPSRKDCTSAIDVNGDIRWYLKNIAIWDNSRLKNGHMMVSTERRLNAPYYMTGLYEIDLLGKIYNEYSLEGGYHHDYYEMPNGNLLVASNDFNSGEGTVEDYIVELDRKTGKTIKTIDLKKILKRDDGKSENWSSYDWFHNNSVWYDKKTNSITLSGRHKDAIINIDYDTQKLNWIIGDPTNWDKEYQKYFFKPVNKTKFEWQWSQHAAMITPEGYVFVLDNGNNKSKIKEKYVKAENSYTRGVMYKIDTKAMTIEQIWQYGKERGSKFYSPYISDVDYLNKNHYIVHSGGIVYVDGKISNQPAGFSDNPKMVSDTVEILNDETVFEIKLPTNNYRVEKMNPYSINNFEIKRANKLGSLGTTKIDKKEFWISKKIAKIDDEYKKHNIKITQEEDRIIFTGQFKKGTNVNLVLYKGLEANYYNVPISKKPYTALCVDVFTDEENEKGIVVNKYINKEKLSGKYSIYVEIDDKLYNTESSVNFEK